MPIGPLIPIGIGIPPLPNAPGVGLPAPGLAKGILGVEDIPAVG